MGKLEEKEKEKMYKRGLNWVLNINRDRGIIISNIYALEFY